MRGASSVLWAILLMTPATAIAQSGGEDAPETERFQAELNLPTDLSVGFAVIEIAGSRVHQGLIYQPERAGQNFGIG